MASSITRIQIVQDSRGGGVVIVVSTTGGATEDDGGGGKATVGEAGVEAGERGVARQEGIVTGMALDRSVGGGEAVPGELNGGDVGAVPLLGQLGPVERLDPSAHVVPYRCPRP